MSFCAAILAGGKSARFGHRPKGLAPLGGRTVIERQLAVLAGRARRIALVGDNLAPFAEVAAGAGVELVADAARESGPMAGLLAALEWASSEWLFAVAGDLPLINDALIDALLPFARRGVSMVAPVVESRVQPLAAFYNRSSITRIKDCLRDGLLSPRRLFDAEDAVRVKLDDARSLRGFNDEDELAALERELALPL